MPLMTPLKAAQEAVKAIEAMERASTEGEILTLSVRARGWLCLAADGLQPNAGEQATTPLPTINL